MSDSTATHRAGDPSRRALVAGVVGFGVGVPLVAACGTDDSADAGGGSGSDSGSGSGSGGTGTTSGAIGKTSEVPVGGGKIFAGEKVVITQPSAGDFKAFSAVCTHQGCVVAEIKGDEIDCTCHGSKFSIVDGSNTQGPNNSAAGSIKPLEALKVTVSGDDLSVA